VAAHGQKCIVDSIPTEIGHLTDMAQIGLHFNQLSSNIPTELGLLTKLSRLYMHDNDLIGSIPTEIGNLVMLVDTMWSSNLLHSTLPSEIGSLSSLWRLVLSNNSLSGTIPTEVGFLKNLAMPNANSFSFKDFVGLKLDKISFDGRLPSEIGLLSSLPGLVLQGNKLSGVIPQELFALAENGFLADLNVTGNIGLSGLIPQNVCLADMLFDFDCGPSLCGCACPCEGTLIETQQGTCRTTQANNSIHKKLIKFHHFELY